ncbi:MAG TPA: response regulator [Polyangiaceae bacterium]|nr:response regulator [Polyangiaceae bacterium]
MPAAKRMALESTPAPSWADSLRSPPPRGVARGMPGGVEVCAQDLPREPTRLVPSVGSVTGLSREILCNDLSSPLQAGVGGDWGRRRPGLGPTGGGGREMGAKILVIDDSMLIRSQVSKALTAAGFSVIEAIDGVDGLQKLADAPDTRLVVCDVNMPRMSGMDFLERVQARGDVSVLMLTSEGQSDLIKKAKALGAKAWIIKPFKPELLVAAAKKLTA